jgi:site-specific DNA-methyltransferase (adenine-specific)
MSREQEANRQIQRRLLAERNAKIKAAAPVKPAAPAVIKATHGFREEYLAENVRLICADCREILPTLPHMDSLAVVSDPPFGIGDIVKGYGRSDQRSSGRWNDRHIVNDRDLSVMVEAFDLIRNQFTNIWLASFYSDRNAPAFFKATATLDYYGGVIWDKLNVGLGYSGIRYRHENIAFFRIGQPPEMQQLESVLPYGRIMREDRSAISTRIFKSSHPHEKPVSILRSLIRATPGDTILDPFCGTGVAGVAAHECHRGFIGIEFDPIYYDIARRKIGDAQRQPVDFWEDCR